MTSKITGQQWIRTTDNRTGRQLVVAVPSKSVPGKYHLVGFNYCDCIGFMRRSTCSHLRAVQAEVEGRKAAVVRIPVNFG